MAAAAAMLTSMAVPAGAAVAVTVTSSGAPAAAETFWCIRPDGPVRMYQERKPPLPHPCAPGFMLARTRDGVNKQLITVGVRAYHDSFAKVEAFTWTGTAWQRVYGPYTARVGYAGMAPPGHKVEGDLRTPQGTFGFSFFFGVKHNPGVHFSFRHAYTYDVWDDDPYSPRYNEWINERRANPGVNPEPMHNVPAYNYAAVIAYNTARIPWAGSAIFLHVGNGSATAGCVSLPQARLLKILRWMRPGRRPVIAMRVVAH